MYLTLSSYCIACTATWGLERWRWNNSRDCQYTSIETESTSESRECDHSDTTCASHRRQVRLSMARYWGYNLGCFVCWSVVQRAWMTVSYLGKPRGTEIRSNLPILNFKQQLCLSWGRNTPPLSCISVIPYLHQYPLFLDATSGTSSSVAYLGQSIGGLILTRFVILEKRVIVWSQTYSSPVVFTKNANNSLMCRWCKLYETAISHLLIRENTLALRRERYPSNVITV